MRRTRFLINININTIPVKRARFYSLLEIGDVTQVRRTRYYTDIAITPYQVRRARFFSELTINTATAATYSYPTILLENLISDGKGSVSCDDLSLIKMNDGYLYFKPGFFYDNYVEYFYNGDEYNVYTTDTGTSYIVSKSALLLNPDHPISVTTEEPTTQIYQTYNPTNYSSALRKVVDVSNYTESLDGLSAYSFALDSGQYQLIDTGESSNYEFRFYATDTGIKYIIHSSGDISYLLPEQENIATDINGFIAIRDDNILITPNSIQVYTTPLQYTDSIQLNAMIEVKGSRGERVSGYPLLVNSSSYATSYNGTCVATGITSLLVHVTTDTGSLPTYIDTGSYNFDEYYMIEKISTAEGLLA